MRFGNNWDLCGAQLLRARAHNVAGFTGSLGSGGKGRMEFDTTSGQDIFGVWNGSAWVKLRDDWISGVSPASGSPITVTGTGALSLDIALASGSFLLGNGSNVGRPTAKSSIPISGFGAAQAAVNCGSQRLTNVGSPVDPGDAVTKAYADDIGSGIDQKTPCRVATTEALPAHTFLANIMTASADGAIPDIDGVTLEVGDRVLVKDEGSGTHLENGIYTVTALGDADDPWILTRAGDADESSEVDAGLYTLISEGTIWMGSGWRLVTENPTLNTTALTFTQFSAAGQFSAGNGIAKVGTQIHFAQSTAYTPYTIPYASDASTISFLGVNSTETRKFLRQVSSEAPAWDIIGLSDVDGLTAALAGKASALSGTQNRIAKFATTSTIGVSQIVDNGTYVGIGVTDPASTIDLPVSKGIRWRGQAGVPMTQHSYHAEFNGQVDDILITGYNVKEGYFGDTQAGKIEPTESTFLLHLESNVKTTAPAPFTNQHEWGIDFLSPDGASLLRPLFFQQERQSPYRSITYFANTKFCLLPASFPHEESSPMFRCNDDGTSWFNTNGGSTHATVTIATPSEQALNQQLVLTNAGAYHTGLVASHTPLTPLADNNAWGLFGGNNSYLWGGGAAYRVGFLFGSGVPAWMIRWTDSHLNSSTGTTALTVLKSGNTGIATDSPSNRLHVYAASNPIRCEGLQAGTDDSFLTTDANGVFHKRTTVPSTALTGSIAIARLPVGLSTCTAGDTLYASGADTWARLAANGSATRKFLSQVSSSAPTWDVPAVADVYGLEAALADKDFSVSARNQYDCAAAPPVLGNFETNLLTNYVLRGGTATCTPTGCTVTLPEAAYTASSSSAHQWGTITLTAIAASVVYELTGLSLPVPLYAYYYPYLILRSSSYLVPTNIKVEYRRSNESTWDTIFNSAPGTLMASGTIWRGANEFFANYPITGVRFTLTFAGSVGNECYLQEVGVGNLNAYRNAYTQPWLGCANTFFAQQIINATNPLRLIGIQSGTDVKYVTTDDNGVLHYRSGIAIASVTGLTEALAGKAASVHTHVAGDISGGTFDTALIPNLNASKITTGALGATVTIDSKAICRKVTANVPIGTTTLAISHGLNTTDLTVMLKTAAGEYLMTDFNAISASQVSVIFEQATTEAFTAVILG